MTQRQYFNEYNEYLDEQNPPTQDQNGDHNQYGPDPGPGYQNLYQGPYSTIYPDTYQEANPNNYEGVYPNTYPNTYSNIYPETYGEVYQPYPNPISNQQTSVQEQYIYNLPFNNSAYTVIYGPDRNQPSMGFRDQRPMTSPDKDSYGYTYEKERVTISQHVGEQQYPNKRRANHVDPQPVSAPNKAARTVQQQAPIYTETQEELPTQGLKDMFFKLKDECEFLKLKMRMQEEEIQQKIGDVQTLESKLNMYGLENKKLQNALLSYQKKTSQQNKQIENLQKTTKELRIKNANLNTELLYLRQTRETDLLMKDQLMVIQEQNLRSDLPSIPSSSATPFRMPQSAQPGYGRLFQKITPPPQQPQQNNPVHHHGQQQPIDLTEQRNNDDYAPNDYFLRPTNYYHAPDRSDERNTPHAPSHWK